MLIEYIGKLVNSEVYISEKYYSMNDSSLCAVIMSSFSPKCHLNDLKEMRAYFSYRLKRLNYPSIDYSPLNCLLDPAVSLRHDKHGAVLLSIVGEYLHKFKPEADFHKECSLNKVLEELDSSMAKNNVILKENCLNAIYYIVNEDNFSTLADFAMEKDFGKNKKLFASIYGWVAFNTKRNVY